ncbi:MAG TPA: leucine-rich repeat domain-containing protein [Actinocrinis sp.]|uniref:leucine-rich repeat domain-containing protein n=1 Tax=Actinocrinis sp. TaxID=1920516 RepID=UPI002D48A966|nr:leucine-rich repeat domain-containing protein [Actinocrinis sp.]HZU57543.1 leucine-rich repeat domain-containing protein [Actinocrinis sp.]
MESWGEQIAQRRIARAVARGETKLKLVNLGLTRIPEEVRSLPRLDCLDVSGNHLAQLPSWLREQRDLVWLALDGNELTEVPEWIGDLSRLECLWLHANQLTRLPESLASLRGLIKLNVSSNPLAELPDWLGRLDVRDLRIQDLELTRPPEWLALYDRLTTLSLGDNRLTELPEWLGDITTIRRLWAPSNQLTEMPRSVKRLTWLESLDLSGNRLAEVPSWIGDLTELRSLDLSQNEIRELPASLGASRRLTTLLLNENRISSLPDSLASLNRLTNLNIGSNDLPEVPEWIGQLPQLRRLHLGGLKLNELPGWIARLDQLNALDLFANNIGTLPEWIGRLKRLKNLYIGSNLLTALPSEIASLAHLTTLTLSYNNIGALPSWLGECRQLRTLEVSACGLQDLPESLFQLTRLRYLSLRGNKLSQVPPSIGRLRNLEHLNIGLNQLPQIPDGIRSLNRLTNLWAEGIPHADSADWIADLPRLMGLSVGHETLTELPSWIRKLRHLRTLQVSGSGLTHLPDWVGELRLLHNLYLSGNRLPSLPDSLRRLARLNQLQLSDNQLSQLPDRIGDLRALTFLDLGRNELTRLPDSVGELTGLTNLRLEGNQLTSLPDSLSQLSNLEDLSLSNNDLGCLPDCVRGLTGLHELHAFEINSSRLPTWIGEFKLLAHLDLDGNGLTALPESVGRLQHLRVLDLRRNELAELPESMRGLRGIKDFYLHDNKLRSLPDWLLEYPGLENLTVHGNPLLSPPPEVAASGTASTLEFLKERRKGASQQWSSKMLVVGEGAVGKTSAIKRLVEQPFDPAESTTHGLRVFTYDLAHPNLAGTRMTLSTWDFGGQEIYHATHQFFLTERSLFLLLWNSRLGWVQGRLRYWLDIIAARAPKSPVLLVATHAPVGGRPVDLPLDELRAEYPQIVDNIAIDNESEDGLAALRAEIARQAAALPLMGTEWPVTWLQAANAVRTRPETHVSPSQLWQTMASAGLGNPQHQRYVATALHELGDILFYQDDSELADTVVLQPEWVNGYISKVLDSPEVERCHGLLRRQHMDELWNDLDRGLRDHFLGMMDKYDLSYKIDGGRGADLSLVVERLPWNAPPYQKLWDAATPGEHEIRVVYQLNTTPPGIPTWFIARSHRFSTGTHWRTGALLAHTDGRHRALIRTDSHRNCVELAVRGPSPAAFFAILDDGLNLTLDRYPGLSIRRMVPCPCRSAQDEQCSELFDYDDLQRRLARTPPRHEIECRKSGEEIHVPLLLLGLAPSEHDAWRDSLERINATLTASQAVLSERIEDLRGDLQRQFLKVQQQLQAGFETSCPCVLTVSVSKESRIKGTAYELSLYCEEPGAWHPLPDGAGTYELSESAAWLRRFAPYLRELVTILKHAAPLAGPVLGMTVEKLDARIKADADAMKALIDQLLVPDVLSLPSPLSAGRENSQGSPAPAPTQHATSEADFRALRAALEKLDPDQRWGGLSRVATPEGLTLYLCREHAGPYLRTPRAPAASP